MKDDNKTSPTLVDVARHAGVSIASVSRVLNGVQPISQGLRAKVENAVKELGYKSRKTSLSLQPTVVVLLGDINNPYYSEILSGIVEEANKANILIHSIINRRDEGFSRRFLKWIAHEQPEGLILATSIGIKDEDLKRLLDIARIPIVAINRLPGNKPDIPSIRIDFERAMANATRHLLRFGHMKIALISGIESNYVTSKKKLGFIAALKEAGIESPLVTYIKTGSTIEGGFEATNRLLETEPRSRPTAILASNDLIALGALHSIRSHGLSIPENISVVGFDDIAMAAHANPPLTSVSPPKFEMGVKAMKILLEEISSIDSPNHDYVVLESPLIVRESSGPAPVQL